MRNTWTVPILIAGTCLVFYCGCPIPFGYYSAGNNPTPPIQITDGSNTTAVSPVVFLSGPATGGDAVVVSGTVVKPSNQLITLHTATPDARIYYCTDTGSLPNPNASNTFLYQSGQTIEVSNGSPVTISAIAFKALMPPSAVSTLAMRIEYLELTVDNFAISSTSGVFSEITATVTNSGAVSAVRVPYEIVLSDTTPLDPMNTYPVIYASAISVAAVDQTNVSVPMQDVANYVAANPGPTDGQYYLGLVIDPDNTTGYGPFETTLTSQNWFLNGTLAQYKLSGNISADPYTATYWGFCRNCNYQYINANMIYTVYYGVIAANDPFVSSTPASTNRPPDQIFEPGWQSVSATYSGYPDGISPIPYTVGAPGTGPFVVAAFIDWDNDGLVSTDTASMIVDPIAMAGYANGNGFVTQTYSQDTSAVDLTFPMSPN